MVMKRTTVWLTPRELAALQRAARLTQRTQSDLIREGVRKVTMGIRLPGMAKPINTGINWFTQEEELAFILQRAGHPPQRIAQELRISVEEAKLVLARHAARSKRMLNRPRPEEL
jgi:hypothetical protein